MILMGLGAGALFLAAGWMIKRMLDSSRSRMEITKFEYTLGGALGCLLVIPLSLYAGYGIARTNQVTFTEYRNGHEIEAAVESIRCTKDGSCKWTYDCDPYQDCHETCTTDSNGNQSCSQSCTTKYRQCPYCTHEYNYFVNTTVGRVVIDMHRLPENPHANRWKQFSLWEESLPQRVIDRAGSGAPQFWSQVKARLDSGAPGPVTLPFQYPNYILAADRSILKQASGDVEFFRDKRLLPDIASGVYNFYFADKVHLAGGVSVGSYSAWQHALMRFNAAVGSRLHGDVRLVLANSPDIHARPDEYLMALKAHWQDRNVFGRHSLPKNAVVVVVGTRDNLTVDWARAITGMPLGNEHMLFSIQNRLKGVSFTPEGVLGTLQASLVGRAIQVSHGNGALERVVFGIDEPVTRFQRVSMSARDPGDAGTGFLYLMQQIQPTGKQKAFILIATFFGSLLIWFACAVIGERRRQHGWSPYRRYR